MRLLNTQTLDIVHFNESEVPPYAILSHTWGKEEITLEDLKAGNVEGKEGYHKIRRSSEIAARDKLAFIWIDTCCIDKSSSAELSEAINSMYRYYRDAVVCYAYLSDMITTVQSRIHAEFASSKWFSRGWTLQELIAPSTIIFFSSKWKRIGTKQTLSANITVITRVDRKVLEDATRLDEVSIAKRMSWAASRITTREEDVAYCLLGIFNVNMPLLYGEGRKSFLRLQEEIMKDSTDQSLFAWSPQVLNTGRPYDKLPNRGVLANHPSEFASASDIMAHQVNLGPYSMTNKGLYIKLPVILRGKDELHVAVLACHVSGNFKSHIGVLMQPTTRKETSEETLEETAEFSRYCSRIELIGEDEMKAAQVRSVYILKEVRRTTRSTLQHAWIRSIPPQRYGFQIEKFLHSSSNPQNSWDIATRTMSLSSEIPLQNQPGAIILKHQSHPALVIITFGVGNRYVFLNIDLQPEQLYSDNQQVIGRTWAAQFSNPRTLPWSFLCQKDCLEISPGTIINVTVEVRTILDEETLVLDIDMRGPLSQEIFRAFASKLQEVASLSWQSLKKSLVLMCNVFIELFFGVIFLVIYPKYSFWALRNRFVLGSSIARLILAVFLSYVCYTYMYPLLSFSLLNPFAE